MEGWDHPVSREAAILMDNWDALSHQVYKKPKPYPRPWPEQRPTQRHGNAVGRTPEQVKAILRNASALLAEGPV